MTIAAIGIVGKDNKPLLLRTKYDYLEEGKKDETERLKLIIMLHSCLDLMDDRQSHHPTSQHRDPFLGLLTQLENYKVYGLLSTTKTKVLLIISVSSTSLRETDVKGLLKQIHTFYIEGTTCNPFHIPGEKISSR